MLYKFHSFFSMENDFWCGCKLNYLCKLLEKSQGARYQIPLFPDKVFKRLQVSLPEGKPVEKPVPSQIGFEPIRFHYSIAPNIIFLDEIS